MLSFKPYYFLLSIFVIPAILFVSVPASYAATANLACPGNIDTVTYVDPANGQCHSSTNSRHDTGFNVVEGSNGRSTCGQVACPGDISNIYRYGHTCVVLKGGQCYPGSGASGFNSSSCTADPFAPNPIPCPSPMDLRTQILDATGNPLSGITLTVTYSSGLTATATTDANGQTIISGKLYSGDHFILVPSSPNYTFEPSQYGNTSNFGVLEMNTLWSCGTPLGDGTTNDPCLFTAFGTNMTPPPPAKSCTDCAGRTPAQAYFCTNSVSNQGFCTNKAFKPFSCQSCISVAGTSTNLSCQNLQGVCQTKSTCDPANQLDSGTIDCGAGNTCCTPPPYRPNLTSTLIVFGALALIGLFL